MKRLFPRIRLRSVPWAVALGSFCVLGLPETARANAPLTQAVIEALRNQVRLMPQSQSPRTAAIRDRMTPGDGLATGQAALAELRFNDGSLARVGEQVVFWFVPRTRSFRLSNGTVLMLIPPGRGTTRIHTPNVTTGIRGSALFVRYIQETDTTIVGALTDSGIEVWNRDASQRQELEAGQMVVIEGNEIKRLFDFDLETFYQTSNLAQGLGLDSGKYKPFDVAIAAVQEETLDALVRQVSFEAETVELPIAMRMPDVSFDNLVAFRIDASETTSFGPLGIRSINVSQMIAEPDFLGGLPLELAKLADIAELRNAQTELIDLVEDPVVINVPDPSVFEPPINPPSVSEPVDPVEPVEPIEPATEPPAPIDGGLSEIPETPETPEVPEIPETPETPEIPETPETPENPEVPEIPETPETPEIPETPEEPETPETPEIPETPEEPETPETPEIPETPEEPEIPETPETPEEPETPGGDEDGGLPDLSGTS